MILDKKIQKVELLQVPESSYFKLSQNISKDFNTKDVSLKKAQGILTKENQEYNKYLTILIINLLIQNRQNSQLETVEQLVNLLNKHQFESKYFEEINISEYEQKLLIGSFNKLQINADILTKVYQTDKYFILSLASYGLYLNSQSINPSFLECFENNNTLNGEVKQIAQELQLFVQGQKTKENKAPQQQDIQYIYQLANTRDLLNQVVDQVINNQYQNNDFMLLNKLKSFNKNINQLSQILYARSIIIDKFYQFYDSINIIQDLNELNTNDLASQINELQKFVSQFQVLLQASTFLSIEQLEQIYKNEKKSQQGKGTLKLFQQIQNQFKVQISKEEEQVEQEKLSKMSDKEKGIYLKKQGVKLSYLFVDQQQILNNYESFIKSYFNVNNQQLFFTIKENIYNTGNVLREAKLAKGTRDAHPYQMSIKNQIFDLIKNIFQKYGACQIDTPVFELKETLVGKLGNDEKLIYDLNDQGGEICSLRYDLTVPFARYMGQHMAGKNKQFKRFQFGKVYRRDQPNMAKGRYREFYQCDLDITGTFDNMFADAEVIAIFNEIIGTLGLGKYLIKINSRKILNSILKLSGVEGYLFKAVCSSIDKLDKEPWENVQQELINDKGLTQEQTEKIKVFIEYQGEPLQLCEKLINGKVFQDEKEGTEGIKDLYQMFQYLEKLGQLQNTELNLSLARGLDYYTGMIFEAVLLDQSIGSISGGGRYDDLLGKFSKDKIPSVGGSIGVERIFHLIEQKYLQQYEGEQKDPKQNQTLVYITTTVGDAQKLNNYKLELASILRKNNIPTEYSFKVKAKLDQALDVCLKQRIPIVIFIGGNELESKSVTLKSLYLNEKDSKGELIPQDKLLERLQQLIQDYKNKNPKSF